jgi:KaiC/GvpD/RAD55 family RecA-like ATPase
MSNEIVSVEPYQILGDQLLSTEIQEILPAIMSADYILTRVWPEPIWAVPKILPVGFAILAGAPKVGKSWLALQIAQAVASGGYVMNQRVEKGKVLYIALEDSPRRLKERMNKQKWPQGLEADFITVGLFQQVIGDISKGGIGKLAELIEEHNYRMVILDTLSRAIKGDQNDVGVMTASLTPVQEMAHKYNITILLIDHHKKVKGEEQDAIGDILGSTAKGAMTDTVLGLYRERGKSGAKLSITGREVDEQVIDIYFDKESGCWQVNTKNNGVTQQQDELYQILLMDGPETESGLADKVGRVRGSVHKQLIALDEKGKAKEDRNIWSALTENEY